MPSVFLSYAHKDIDTVELVAKALADRSLDGKKISVWRDKENLQAGERWPKRLGEAISHTDCVLLIWSRNAAESDYVDLEWNTAIALQRLLIPCLLDDTSLPPLLHSFQRVSLRQPEAALAQMFARLSSLGETTKPSPEEIISKLDKIPDSDHKTALKAANDSIFYDLRIRAGHERRDRDTRILLDSVKRNWINGYLRPNIKGSRSIDLHKTIGSDAVDNPRKGVVELPNITEQPIPDGKPLIDLFDEVAGFLLILGEPGSGKTITLLELAASLLDRAEADSEAPIPVIFNLSTWSNKWNSLLDWLVSELGMQYRVGKALGQSWIKDRRLIVLLDGFDEISPESRAGCVQAINRFLTEPGVWGMVVCSRTKEYCDLQIRLRVNAAIRLQPLTDAQIDRYLADAADSENSTLRTLIESDSSIKELAESPLMLSIMYLAYSQAPEESAELKDVTSAEQRRKRLFDRYMARMFKRKGEAPRPYTQEQVVRSLSWLADQMDKHSQTQFFLENLQPSWLASASERWLYWILSRTAGPALLGLLIAGLLIPGILSLRSNPWLIFGLSLGVLAAIPAFLGLALGIPAGIIDGILLDSRRSTAVVAKGRGLFKLLSLYVLGYAVFNSLWIVPLYFMVMATSEEDPVWPLLVFIGMFCLYSLFPGFRSAQRNRDFDIRTTEAMPWSWSKASTAYLLGLLVAFLVMLLVNLVNLLSIIGIRTGKDDVLMTGGFALGTAQLLPILLLALAMLPYARLAKLRKGRWLSWLGAINPSDKRQSFRNLLILQTIVAAIGGFEYAFSGPKNILGMAGFASAVAVGTAQAYGGLFAVFGGLKQRTAIIEAKTYPNQGIILSIRNALIVTLYVSLVLMLLTLPVLFVVGTENRSERALIPGLSAAFFGCAIGSWFGLDVLQHYALRTILYWKGRTPRHYVRFLDYAASLIFLRKVGGGYVFIHRLVLEYFANLAQEEKRCVASQGNCPDSTNLHKSILP